MTWFERLANKRPPDLIIGDPKNPYMLRWWVIPRNRFFNIYLHKFLLSDDARALHDHPWANMSYILKGYYLEVTQGKGPFRVRRYDEGCIKFRGPWKPHRIVVHGPCWSLFITGPVMKEWGFHCPHGWVHNKDFTNPSDPGQIGRGCE